MAFRIQAVVSDPRMQTAFDRYLLSTGEDTSDLLTQEYHEHLYPRLDYTKVRRLEEMGTVAPTVTVHASLLVDAFREDDHKFEHNVGELLPHWPKFQELVKSGTSGGWEELKKVHSFAPPFHSEPLAENQRRVIFTPLKEKPEYLRMLADTLFSWIEKDDDRNPFPAEGVAYFELVSWDASALAQAHNGADWVILFDRHLDKNLFQQQPFQDISLIDFYPQLPGGYKLSVSSGRKEAVAWQLRQVLRQFDLDMDGLPQQIIDSLKVFAGGLLLKTLGGGSLAQELLGLYATFQQLKADSLFIPTQDWLIPLDNYQSWFGRRTQSGCRADLLVVRRYDQQTLEMIAVESKWYSRAVDSGFVKDEFGEDGQLWVAVKNLSELFDPQQPRNTEILLAGNAVYPAG